MVLMWIKRNKYKLIVGVFCAYLLTDMIWHKGLLRTMIPADLPAYRTDSAFPASKSRLFNTNKEWVKGINSIALMDQLDKETSGLECDIYFDQGRHFFDVHHDEGTSTGLNLDDLFTAYLKKGLGASVWLDFKNLDKDNSAEALTELNRLRAKYKLYEKLLVESSQAALLKSFSDSGYFTSYYVPQFNPYLMKKVEMKKWADSVYENLQGSSVNALSGYYYQYSFLHKYFPKYPVLTWAPNDRFSLVNWLFRKQQGTEKSVFIALYP